MEHLPLPFPNHKTKHFLISEWIKKARFIKGQATNLSTKKGEEVLPLPNVHKDAAFPQLSFCLILITLNQ